MHRWAAVAWVWLCAVAPVTAQPTALPLELAWSAPAECPSAAAVRGELERIARVRPGYALRPLSAEARVTRKPSGYRVALRTEHEGRRGARDLEASDCRTLVRSVTLVLALAFGPALELTNPPEPKPVPKPKPVPVPDSVPVPESVPVPSSPPLDLALSLLLSASAALDLFPSLTPTATAGLHLRLAAYALEARATFFATATSDLTPTIRTHVRALGGSLAACRLDALSAAFTLTACAGARLASLTARTTGRLERASATAPWTALTAGAFVAWPRRSWLRLRLELALSLSLSRPRFVVASLGDAHRVPLFVPELGLSLLLTF